MLVSMNNNFKVATTMGRLKEAARDLPLFFWKDEESIYDHNLLKPYCLICDMFC